MAAIGVRRRSATNHELPTTNRRLEFPRCMRDQCTTYAHLAMTDHSTARPPPDATREAVRFTVEAWSAWAPGLTDVDAWRAWALAPMSPTGPGKPDLAHFPPMLRRRAERLARMALETTHAVRPATPCPMLFASRHGELARAVQLLTELAREQRVSPGPFSLSVHNAVAGLYSIANADGGHYSAIAAGRETVEAALVEAASLLADGAPEVVVTIYEDLIPAIFLPFADEADAAFAWSWRLSSRADGDRYTLGWRATPPSPRPVTVDPLPHALDVLRFFLSTEVALETDGSNHRWRLARES